MNYLLTKKQNEVMKYLAQGLSNKKIMAKMGIKYTTLRSHLVDIYQFFGVHDKLNAVLVWQKKENEVLWGMVKEYKTVLEEIREIADKLITELPEYSSCYYKDECGDNCTPKKQSKVEYCCYENVDKILTIINEVLNDRN